MPADVSDLIGGYGPWQRDIFVLLFLASIPSAWHNLQMSFMAPRGVEFRCAPPPHLNVSSEEWRNRSAPPPDLDVDGRCYVTPYWRLSPETVLHRGDLLKCTAWEYKSTANTVIDEWDLVCDREWLVSFSTSIYNVGYLVAVLVFGQLSDSLGRRPTLLFSFIMNVGAGLISAFSPSFAVFAILRFFTAVGAAGFYTVSFVILLEMVSPPQRPVVGVAINLGWCLAFVSLPGIAWIVRDWFWLQLTLTLPKLLFIPIFWLIPESPRWLLVKKEQEKFVTLVRKAATKNRIPLEWLDAQLEKFEMDGTRTSSATVLDLFKTPRLRRNTLVLFYNWLVNSFVYFGLSYNAGQLSPNPYLSFFLSGAVEFPAYLLTMHIIKRVGRKKPLIFAMMVTAGVSALHIPVPENLVWLKAFFPLVGKFCITATFATVYVYSAELFPTVVRNSGLGTGSTVARIGSTVAPFAAELSIYPCLPDLLYSLLSLTSGCLVFLLPETNNEPFADTVEQAEHIGVIEEKVDDELQEKL